MTVHPTAKACIRWAVALTAVGAVLLAFGPDLYARLVDLAGANATTGLHLVNLVLTFVRAAIFPMGAVLVGTAIVIQTLAGSGVDARTLAPHDEHTDR
ncbi:hypothetical protein [Actinotalea sp. K2]|uniref:hypothetical protein n=1 Tax=Actinotalea sp. K2 TaxID=2939438 RepID=UPI002016C32C|nr:hypothetical protein [Actinotalea sp. K2]MCL3863145.1 hypothetical protein [Actinotalea sp. K2]